MPKTKDFSSVEGRRLRITLGIYRADIRQFRHVKGIGARVTVATAAEQRRLWRAIEATIERGDWRQASGDSLPDAVPAGISG